MKILLIKIISIYKSFISPITYKKCRFYPSCSDYAYEAIKYYGSIYGIYLLSKRLFKCNPLFQGGIDLVPKKITYIKQ